MSDVSPYVQLLLNGQLDVYPLVGAYGGNDDKGVNRAVDYEFSSSPTFTLGACLDEEGCLRVCQRRRKCRRCVRALR